MPWLDGDTAGRNGRHSGMLGVGLVDDRRRFAGRSSSVLPAYSLFRGIKRISTGVREPALLLFEEGEGGQRASVTERHSEDWTKIEDSKRLHLFISFGVYMKASLYPASFSLHTVESFLGTSPRHRG
jgi:hypothetical protein